MLLHLILYLTAMENYGEESVDFDDILDSDIEFEEQ